MGLVGRETELASVDRAVREARAGEPRALGFGEAGIGNARCSARRELAELVADGRSKKQAAAALLLSETTIEHHLSRIYATVGVRSRSELAARMAR